MQGAYYQEVMGMKSLKIKTLSRCKRRTNLYRPAMQYHRSLHRSIVQSMEIRVYSRLILARYKGCTNARFILSRSYGHEEFKNANPF